MNAQKPDRHELQANGNHPAPCAKFCEATAFTIELRRAQAKIERLKEEITGLHEDAAGTSPVEPSQAQPPAPSDTAITYMTGYSDGREWAQPSQAVGLNDAKRLDWIRDQLFEHKWNGVVGKGCAVQWVVAPDFRFKQRELTDDSGITAGDFRRAIDAAINAKGDAS